MRTQTGSRKILFSFLALVFSWIFLELCSGVGLWLQGSPVGDHSEYYRGMAGGLYNVFPLSTRVPHPYFGHVYDMNYKHANNMGFFDEKQFPYQKAQDEFTIGCFGGSVAVGFCTNPYVKTMLADAVREVLPGAKSKKIMMLNFALGGGKQPQQHYIFSYFLDSIDFAINLDGWNEIFIEPSPKFPIDFPDGSDFFFQNKLESATRLGPVRALNEVSRMMASFSQHIPFSQYSQIYYLAIKGVREVALSWENEVRQVLSKDDGWKMALDSDLRDPKTLSEKMAKTWSKYTLLQHALASYKRIPSVFFLQPSQYVPQSKNFSEEEMLTAFEPGKTFLSERYSLLENEILSLRKKGVPIHSLSKAFLDNNETLYRDTCCHLNGRGEVVLGQVVANKIRENFRIIRKPARAD